MASNSVLPQAQTSAAGVARVPVARPRLPAAETILPYLERIDEARWYSNFGPLLTEFEARLADRFAPGATVVTAANATQALALALMAMQLPAGGAVILPAWTFVATAHAVMQAGLSPWFVDVEADGWTLDPAAVADVMKEAGEKAVAVIPVSPFGQPLDLDAWLAFREATGVPVLIDAAAGFDTIADARLPAVVSLHATKALGVGEGGFVATNDPAFALRIRQLTTFGFHGSRDSQFPATNAKLSEYTAAVGLAALDGWPAERLRLMRTAQHLRISLIGCPQVVFQPGWGSAWATSVCSVEMPAGSASAVMASLAADGVETRQWWGAGCHTSPAFAACRRTSLANTDRLGSSVIGLPFAVDLSADETARIADALPRAIARA